MKLTQTQFDALRRLSGDKAAPWPKRRQNAEKVVRSLIERGLIRPVGWTLTEEGKAVLSNEAKVERLQEENERLRMTIGDLRMELAETLDARKESR